MKKQLKPKKTIIAYSIIICVSLLLSGCGIKSEPVAQKSGQEAEEWEYLKNRGEGELSGSFEAEVVNDQNSSDFSQKYTNEKYGFSFNYPENIVVSEFAEGEQGDIVLGQWNKNEQQDPSASLRAGLAFQIFISEFDEPGPITAERIKKDLPDMAVDEPIHVIVTQNKLTALIFFSQEEGLGKTREIWLVNKGYLYQIITYAGQDWLVGRVMEGWEF